MTSLMCMALAIYFEARGETTDGQMAVGEVVLNRVARADFPNTVCGVVFEEHQFAFTDDDTPDVLPNDEVSRKAITIARELLMGNKLGITSTHYHVVGKKPDWAFILTLDGKIGNHVFYTCQKEC